MQTKSYLPVPDIGDPISFRQVSICGSQIKFGVIFGESHKIVNFTAITERFVSNIETTPEAVSKGARHQLQSKLQPVDSA